MKKNLVVITSALAVMAIGLSFNSCNTAPSTKVELKTEADSISYAFGASISENIESGLHQAGVLVDTFSIVSEYSLKIGAEKDAEKIKTLQAEKKYKVDSVTKANQFALQNFLKGFKDGLRSKASENSYNIGLAFGNQIAQQALPSITEQFLAKSDQKMDKNTILAAVAATVQNKALLLPSASGYLRMKSMEAQESEMKKKAEVGEKNKAEGEKFLAENKGKEGIVALESGVQYKILKEGNGPKPKATDMVKCHYQGELVDGTIFESSREMGQPATFPVQGVISGWTEVLQLMPVGSTWEVYIPSDRAYGEQGTAGAIGPNATLKFQIELLEIVDPS